MTRAPSANDAASTSANSIRYSLRIFVPPAAAGAAPPGEATAAEAVTAASTVPHSTARAGRPPPERLTPGLVTRLLPRLRMMVPASRSAVFAFCLAV
ncbi:hypothetical protein GCM10010218_39920 [Streptomyces mashuensis]|uniref:Uncharacterized protein n=1 Tax=Streptomyces mashuensis TaxID=33904 RepID=A0A919B6N9_9ACTN|nr:hypothetical protein GCM10010218_39920 [Streptomyces mashuensis]